MVQIDTKLSKDCTSCKEEAEYDTSEWEARELEVITHEEAHVAAAGGYAGAISYDYETKADGKAYIVGGSVPIDTSFDSSKPDEMIIKMDTVAAAALAPAQPSSQDMTVASEAMSKRAKAVSLSAEKKEKEQNPVSIFDGEPIFID